MIRRISLPLLLATILSLLLAGCGGTSITEVAGPDTSRCQSALAAVPTLPAQGGRVETTVLTRRECSWSLASQAAWLQVTPQSGQGEATVALIATANPEGTTRNAPVMVNGERVMLTQQAAPCSFSLSPTSMAFHGDGGSDVVELTATNGCSWTAVSFESWVTLSRNSGSGSGSVTLRAAQNEGGSRSTTVRIAEQNVRVTQEEAPPPEPPHEEPSPAPTPEPAATPAPSATPAPAPAPTPTPKPPACFDKKGKQVPCK